MGNGPAVSGGIETVMIPSVPVRASVAIGVSTGSVLPVLPSPRGVHSCSGHRDVTAEVCYRLGAGGLLGRRSGLWYGRCLSSPGLGAVRPACRSSALAFAGG